MRQFADMRTDVRGEIGVERDGRSVEMSIPGADGWRIRMTERQARNLFAALRRVKLGDKDAEMLERAMLRESNALREVAQLEQQVRALLSAKHADTELLNQIRGLLCGEDE